MGARAGLVVVHFGSSGPTLACLRALEADPSPVERAVVVVDNSGDLDAGRVGRALVVHCPDNPGFGAGANRGVAALGEGEWSVFVVLNHDVEVAPGFLAAAVTAVAAPGVGAAGGPLYLDEARRALWYAGGWVSFVTGTVVQSRSPRAAQRARAVGFIPGAALAIAPGAWRRAGGFDPEFFLYNEDLDLCLRLRRLGYSLRFAPGMAAVHCVGAATGSAIVSPLYLENMARTRLLPFRPLALRLYLAVLHSGYVALRAGWHAARGAGGRTAAFALLRGHGRALARVTRAPLGG
jgi:GT2 family glycosyltransferase